MPHLKTGLEYLDQYSK